MLGTTLTVNDTVIVILIAVGVFAFVWWLAKKFPINNGPFDDLF